MADALTLASAQLAVAREYGFASRTRLRDEVTARTASLARQAEASCEASIGDGTGRAARMLAAAPELARYSFAAAVILGDAGRVRTELGRDPGLATQADTRTGWAPLHAASALRWHRPGPRACWPWPGCSLPPAPTPTAAPARRAGPAAGPPACRHTASAFFLPLPPSGEQEYGVARLTANKALRLLVTEGLAVLSPGMGFYVRTDIGQN